MKIREMAWITQINYTKLYSCVYCIFLSFKKFISSVYLSIDQEFATSVTGSVDFLRESAL